MHIYRKGQDITVLNDHLEVRGIGFIAADAYVLHAREPVVVDTGLGLPDRDFVRALAPVIDPADVRWIWLTHPDRDHTGGLFELLDAAPLARVVTTFLSAGIMATERPLPLDRVYLLNPGQFLDLGDRRLHAFRPPLFDSPATVGFYDGHSRTCFTSDCFGAPLPTADLARTGDAREVPAGDLRAAQLLWAIVDSPWGITSAQTSTCRQSGPSSTSIRTSSSARTYHQRSASPRSCSTCSPKPPPPTRSPAPTSKHSKRCSPPSSQPPRPDQQLPQPQQILTVFWLVGRQGLEP